MTPATWLFVKGQQTIWIERPHGCSITVSGPDQSREHHDFPDEGALESYQMELADRLAAAGWLLWGVNRDRRAAGPDRRQSATAADRRRPGAEGGT